MLRSVAREPRKMRTLRDQIIFPAECTLWNSTVNPAEKGDCTLNRLSCTVLEHAEAGFQRRQTELRFQNRFSSGGYSLTIVWTKPGKLVSRIACFEKNRGTHGYLYEHGFEWFVRLNIFDPRFDRTSRHVKLVEARGRIFTLLSSYRGTYIDVQI